MSSCMHVRMRALQFAQHPNWLGRACQRIARRACRLAACLLPAAAASIAAATAAASWPHVDGAVGSPKELPRAPMAMLFDAAT